MAFMGYRIRKIDKNQTEIVDILRKMGVKVFITSSIGNGFGDIVMSVYGKLWIGEIKSSKKAKLTTAEAKFHETWKEHVVIMTSSQDAIDFVNNMKII